MQIFYIAISLQRCWIQSDKGIWDKPDLPTEGTIHRKDHLFFWELPKSSQPLTPARNFANFFTFFRPQNKKGQNKFGQPPPPQFGECPEEQVVFLGRLAYHAVQICFTL